MTTPRHLIVLLLLLAATGCSSFRPRPYQPRPTDFIITQTNHSVIVSAAAFTPQQSKKYFDLNLAAKDIQPIWLRIRNDSTNTYWLLPVGTDPFYYSAAEIARRFRRPFSNSSYLRMLEALEYLTFEEYIPPGAQREGFIYARHTPGTRHAQVWLFSENRALRFTTIFPDPDMVVDHKTLDFNQLYAASDWIDLKQETNLPDRLTSLPFYTANAKDSKHGDPLNFIVIANREQLFAALISAGWFETEALTVKTAWRTFLSFLTGKSYYTSPVSPLYVFGRRQDAAFQKARKSIHSRSHLRLWLSPLRYRGNSVWVGQISRDIGVRATTQTPNLTTHIIDPDVDGDRWYLIQDMLRVQALDKVGFLPGGIAYSPDQPGRNLTGDIYYTDGLRAVLFLADNPTALDEVKLLDWTLPPEDSEL
jgi:hypothetical protein